MLFYLNQIKEQDLLLAVCTFFFRFLCCSFFSRRFVFDLGSNCVEGSKISSTDACPAGSIFEPSFSSSVYSSGGSKISFSQCLGSFCHNTATVWPCPPGIHLYDLVVLGFSDRTRTGRFGSVRTGSDRFGSVRTAGPDQYLVLGLGLGLDFGLGSWSCPLALPFAFPLCLYTSPLPSVFAFAFAVYLCLLPLQLSFAFAICCCP